MTKPQSRWKTPAGGARRVGLPLWLGAGSVPDGDARTARRGWRAIAAASVFSARLVVADPAGWARDLPAADREAIEEVAGSGTIAGALPAPRLSDPAQFLAPDAPGRTYRVRDGEGGESDEEHRWQSAGGHRSFWHYRVGDAETGFVERDPDGSYVLSGIEDLRERALTEYRPAEPLLLQGMGPGEERTRRMDVRVYDPAAPREIRYRGTLDVAHRYLGAYRIRTPSGFYDTILTKSVFDGSIGPAHLRDVQYRFFAKGIGIVATVESREVSAAVVYHSKQRRARLLAAAPRQLAECSGAAAAAAHPATSVC